MHATLSEMIIGGVVVETSTDKIVAGVKAQEGSRGKRMAVDAASSVGQLSIPGFGPWR